MFHYLYYSVTINVSKKKFRIVFCCFSARTSIVAPSSSCNFPVKLICWGIHVFICFDNNFYEMKNLINFLLYNYHFLRLRETQKALQLPFYFFFFLLLLFFLLVFFSGQTGKSYFQVLSNCCFERVWPGSELKIYVVCFQPMSFRNKQ